MTTRLVAYKLDFNLASLATTFLVVVIIVVRGTSTGALDTARLDHGIAIANVRFLKLSR